MLTALTRAAIKQSRVTITLMAMSVVIGLLTFFNQPSQEDPEITIRTAQVTALFPGMSTERIERLITQPIEEAVKQIPEIETVESSSRTGRAVVKVELRPQYFNLEPIWADLRNTMDDLAPSLPGGTVGPMVNDDFGRVAITTIALTGAEFTMAELHSEARWLRERLNALERVSRVDLYGVQEERIWLEFDRARIAQLGLTPQEIFQKIAEQNEILPAGALVTDDGQRYTLRPSGAFENVAQIGAAPTPLPDGSLAYIGDLVAIKRGYADPPQQPVLVDGQPAIVLAVSMISNANIRNFAAELEARLAQLEAELPAGMATRLLTHQPPLVEQAIDGAVNNLFQTLATVLIVVMIFLGLRAGTIVGSIVPLTIMLSLVGMLIWGIPLHRISIAAVIIALGLLVDNGVVIVEDIKKRLDGGEERLAAALNASRTLALPLLTSSLTSILAFLPLMLAEDSTGEFLRALSQVIITTLLASWFLSITATPFFCYHFLPATPSASRVTSADAGADSGAMAWLATAYQRWLSGVLRARRTFLAAMLALLAASVVALGQVPSALLPPSARAQFVFHLELPAGASAAETWRVAMRLSSYLSDNERNPDISSHALYVGSGGPRFFLALAPVDPAPHIAFGVVNTASGDDVAAARARLDSFIAAELPEARGWSELLFLGAEPPGTVKIRIFGDDAAKLYALGESVKQLFTAIEGSRQIRSDWRNPILQLDIAIDQERARLAGVAPKQIADSLRATMDGATISDFREGTRTIPIVLRGRAQDRAGLDDLIDAAFLSQSGAVIPLPQIANIRGAYLPYVIKRRNQERAITVSAVHPSLQASELFAAALPALRSLDLPYGWRWEVDGEVAASRKANAALFQYMPHCLTAIVLLLIWQFNSFRRPLIILGTIPLTLIGASLGLNVMRGFLDFNALLGLFALAGIIVNNGIVLIEKIEEERETGKGVREAVESAAAARLRPIVMTSLTTIAGLLPLHFFGGALWYSMTVVMMFGLAVGTLLTLGYAPALYATLFTERQPADSGARSAPRRQR